MFKPVPHFGGWRMALRRYQESPLVDILCGEQNRLLLTDQEMADRLGINRVVWSRIKNRHTTFGRKFLKGIQQAFPEVISYIDSL